MKKTLKITALLAMMVLLSLFVFAAEAPKGVDGTVYALDGITPVPKLVTVEIENLNTGQTLVTNVGHGSPGRYSFSIGWPKSTPIRVTAKNPYHSSSRDLTLEGITRGFDIYLNMTLPPTPPEIISLPTLTATQNSLYSYSPTAVDWNGGSLQYGLKVKPVGMQINQLTGVITWVPGPQQIGNHLVILYVNDGVLEDEQSFTISVSNVNDPPTFFSSPPLEVDQKSEYLYKIVIGDYDNDLVSISLTQAPENMTISGSTVLWEPNEYQVGDHFVAISATDGSESSLQEYVLTVRNLPDAPRIISSPETQTEEDKEYTYSVITTDPDGDSVSIVHTELPEGMYVEGSSLRWVPENSHVGYHNLLVTVSDGVFNTTQIFTLEVINTNDLPILNTKSVVVDLSRNINVFQLDSLDIDGDQIDHSLTVPASGFTLSPGGLLSFKGNKGPDIINVTLSDQDSSASYLISISYSQEEVLPPGSGGGGGDIFPPDESEGTEHTYNIGGIVEEIRINTETPPEEFLVRRLDFPARRAAPFDGLVYGYFLVLPSLVDNYEATLLLSVSDFWLEQNEIDPDDVRLYSFSRNSWNRQRLNHIEDDLYEARSVSGSLFAIAVNRLPIPPEPDVISVPEPSSIVGSLSSNRRILDNTPIKITDVTTGEIYNIETGSGVLSGVFQITIEDVQEHTFEIKVGGEYTGESSLIAKIGLNRVSIPVKRNGWFNAITGNVILGDMSVEKASSLVMILMVLAGAFLFVKYRLKKSVEK